MNTFTIVGLGNPNDEHVGTRHNTGRMLVERFREDVGLPKVSEDESIKALVSSGRVENAQVELILPNNYMNNSGFSVGKHVTTASAAENLVVIYDDIDLPLGVVKIAYGRGAGGHKGVGSIITALRTKSFTRVRVGISPSTKAGKIKKPHGEQAVYDFIMGKFTAGEKKIFKEVEKRTTEILKTILQDGRVAAMNKFN
jgi:peptidyl-tRNA hydrolase, PTH1 family